MSINHQSLRETVTDKVATSGPQDLVNASGHGLKCPVVLRTFAVVISAQQGDVRKSESIPPPRRSLRALHVEFQQ